jgi:hypothetical protein
MKTITAVELACSGRVRLGPLSAETLARLEPLGGEWLEVDPDQQALVVCHIQPGGAPTLSALPAELIALLDALNPEERDAMPGGTLMVRDRTGPVVRLVVGRGEIHIQWPREDWSQAEPVDLESVLAEADPYSARVSGRIRMETPPGAEERLERFVDDFEGLYPEGDLRLERDGATLRASFRDVNVGPEQLLAKLRELADPLDSLDGDLEVGSFVEHALDRDFRLTLEAGTARAERPALWPEG